MSVTIGELIQQFATASGMPEDNADLKAFLSNPTISGAAIPASISETINKGILTMESAKSNPEIIKHFRANLFDGVDKETTDTLKELGYFDQLKDVLAAEKSTPKKITLALKEIKRLEEAKADGKGGKDLQEKLNALTKQVNDFNATKAAEIESIKSTLKSEYDSKFEKMAFSQFIGSKKLANPMGLESDILTQIAEAKISKALAEKGYSKALGESGFTLLNKEGVEVYEGTKKISFSDFAEKTLTEAKLLEIGGNNQNHQQQHQQQQNQYQQQQNGGQKLTSWAKAAMAAAESAPPITE
jgi:hypothetical protein